MPQNTEKGGKTALNKILEEQKKTNKLLKSHVDAVREQNSKIDKLAALLEDKVLTPAKIDLRPLMELQKENNKLIKKRADTAKIKEISYTKLPEKPLNEFF